MPERENYNEWAEIHRKAFGWHFNDDKQMMDAWFPALKAFSSGELMLVSEQMLSEPAMTRDKHRQRLLDLLHKNRSVMRSQEDGNEPQYSWCDDCRGAGLAIVPFPHVESIGDGIWRPIGPMGIYYTATVFCKCRLGLWKRNNFGVGDKRPMTLESYEQGRGDWPGNPDWRQQMRERSEQVRAEMVAGRKTAMGHEFLKVARSVQS